MSFAGETIILQITRESFEAGDVDIVAKLLGRLSEEPAKARAKRSCFVISFESAGVPSLLRDERARACVAKLVQAAPYLGYFLSADAPHYHLRTISKALAWVTSGDLTYDSFLQAHHRLYEGAVAHCAAVKDKPEQFEEIFVVNLLPGSKKPSRTDGLGRQQRRRLLISRRRAARDVTRQPRSNGNNAKRVRYPGAHRKGRSA
jgi:hypothetical protein